MFLYFSSAFPPHSGQVLVYFFDHRVGVGRVFSRGLLSWNIPRELGPSECNVWLEKIGLFNAFRDGGTLGRPTGLG